MKACFFINLIVVQQIRIFYGQAGRKGYPACARSALARRACALRALGLLLADGTPTGERGEDFLTGQPDFFTETAVTPERKVEKSFPRWEISRHVEG